MCLFQYERVDYESNGIWAEVRLEDFIKKLLRCAYIQYNAALRWIMLNDGAMPFPRLHQSSLVLERLFGTNMTMNEWDGSGRGGVVGEGKIRCHHYPYAG